MVGQKVRDVWHQIGQRLSEAHYVFFVFEEIFGSSEKRIAELNKFDGNIGYLLQTLLYQKVVSDICKLLDPPKLGKRTNLSMEALLNLLDGAIDGEQAKRKHRELEQIRRSAKKFTDLRNRKLSHNDFDFNMGATELPGVSRKEIRDLLAEMGVWMNELNLRVLNTTVLYDQGIYNFSGSRFERILKHGYEGEADELYVRRARRALSQRKKVDG